MDADVSVMCTWIIEPSLNSQTDASLLFNATGYLVLDPLRAMQMKPSISKHFISFIHSSADAYDSI